MTRSFRLLAACAFLMAACNQRLPSPSPAPALSTEQEPGPSSIPAGQTPTSPVQGSQDYVIFSINVQDYAHPELSASTVRRIIQLHEQYQVPVDIYLTSTMVDIYRQRAPDLIELLRESAFVAVSYHIRPPKPYALQYDWSGLSQESPDQQYEIILDYESHGLDLRSGLPTDEPGGYQALSQLLGYPPYVASALNPVLEQVIHDVFRDLGAQFSVMHGREVNLGETMDGLFIRPEHVDLQLYEHVGQDAGALIEAAFNQAHNSPTAQSPYFVGIKMHDNDFFAEEAAWSVTYAGETRQPPWDLRRKAELLSEEIQEETWALYESALAFVASLRSEYTPVNAPMLLLLEEGQSIVSAPPSTTSATPTSSDGALDHPRWEPGTLYVTVISHNEQPSDRRPDYIRDAAFYLDNRELLIELVKMLSDHDAAFNFQSDWNYLLAVAEHDQGELTTDTGGANIVRWMSEAMGVEIDPHSHESRYNYADVAYLIQELGVTPTNTVGGFLFDPPDNPQGWQQHQAGLSGRIFPDYFWQAEALWGAATSLHQGSDDHTSGVWSPLDRENFYTHDPGQDLIYIGGCTLDLDGILSLLEEIESGDAPRDGFYTAAIFLAQDFITEESIAELEANIVELEPYRADGILQWVNLSDIAEMWRTDYGARPFQYPCE